MCEREKALKKKKKTEVEKILGGCRVEIKFEEMKTNNSDEAWTNIKIEVEERLFIMFDEFCDTQQSTQQPARSPYSHNGQMHCY